ncbi:MAG TPA: efflux RND transporter periplasmic adaptor subunit [Bryobacteraceae bacterium]|jgi:RND family efflux transporter MFP subunit
MNWIWKVILAGACLLSLAACSKREAATEAAGEAKQEAKSKDEVTISPGEQATATIETEAASLSSAPELLRVKGHIAIDDNRTWRQGVRTTGSVTKVYVGLGDRVKKGQILARYHADEVRDTRAMLRAAVSERERAMAAVTQAQRALDRARRLLELKAGSVQQVELAQQDVVSAQAAVKKADIEVDRTRDLLEDDLKVPAEPSANRADETEDEVPISAPADGFVLEKNVTPGRTVEPNSVTFVIGDLSTVWMLASVRQEDLGKLRAEQGAYVKLADDSRLAGKITNLGQQFDPATRMMQIRIELENPGGRLRPEMLADAEIPVGGGKPALMVPSDAVQQVNGQDVVFVQTAPDRFAVRPVRVGETSGGKTPILEGIQSGERIAVRGTSILKSLLLKASLESE